jgi:hypothetical protein
MFVFFLYAQLSEISSLLNLNLDNTLKIQQCATAVKRERCTAFPVSWAAPLKDDQISGVTVSQELVQLFVNDPSVSFDYLTTVVCMHNMYSLTNLFD